MTSAKVTSCCSTPDALTSAKSAAHWCTMTGRPDWTRSRWSSMTSGRVRRGSGAVRDCPGSRSLREQLVEDREAPRQRRRHPNQEAAASDAQAAEALGRDKDADRSERVAGRDEHGRGGAPFGRVGDVDRQVEAAASSRRARPASKHGSVAARPAKKRGCTPRSTSSRGRSARRMSSCACSNAAGRRGFPVRAGGDAR